MKNIKDEFIDSIKKGSKDIKKFLINNGKDGKSTAPISFFSEEDRDKFVRKE